MKHRLAAILAADMVGYSRLMAADEAKTIKRQKSHRSELIEPKITEFGGRIVQTAGDSFLVEFGSVFDAVSCAVKIQQDVESREAALDEDERIHYRMGVHLGDIVLDGDDIMGDGVNIAARLESLSVPGGVCVSDMARETLQGKLNLRLEDLGEPSLKNIERPVRVWQWSGDKGQDGLAVAAERQPQSLPAKPSIAVLPFSNLSSDAEQEYFSDGITEDIITELARFHSVFVIARNSTFQYKGRSPKIQDVGRDLGVQYVVEGSVARRPGDRLRITAQLVEATNGKHIWAERYDRSLDELFSIQDEVVSEIVGMLETSVFHERLAHAKRVGPGSLQAYDLWLRARKLMESWTPGDDSRAAELLHQAIELDPGFARAHGTLAGVLNARNLVAPGAANAPEALEEGLRCATVAVELDPTDGRNHVDLAWSHMLAHRFRHGERHFQLAEKLNPNDANILIACGLASAQLGNPQRGIVLAEKALRLNPLHPDYYVGNFAVINFLAGDYERCLGYIDLSPNAFPEISGWRAAATAQLGRIEDARRFLAAFRDQISSVWAGPERLDDDALVRWFLDINPIGSDVARDRLIEGLVAAGLPEPNDETAQPRH